MCDTTICLLNQLINEAVCYGGDAGGAYRQNRGKLIGSINTILKKLKLDEDYEPVSLNGVMEESFDFSKCVTSVYARNRCIWTDILILPKDRNQINVEDDSFENIF